ncbi:unnamed protein product [Urochloa humidicola]
MAQGCRRQEAGKQRGGGPSYAACGAASWPGLGRWRARAGRGAEFRRAKRRVAGLLQAAAEESAPRRRWPPSSAGWGAPPSGGGAAPPHPSRAPAGVGARGPAHRRAGPQFPIASKGAPVSSERRQRLEQKAEVEEPAWAQGGDMVRPSSSCFSSPASPSHSPRQRTPPSLPSSTSQIRRR